NATSNEPHPKTNRASQQGNPLFRDNTLNKNSGIAPDSQAKVLTYQPNVPKLGSNFSAPSSQRGFIAQPVAQVQQNPATHMASQTPAVPSLPTRHPSLRLLLLGYGHVAQAFLQLLASRSIWLGNEFGVRPVVCGLGTRSHGLYIYPRGFEASFLAQDADPFQQFINNGTYVDNAGAFIEAGKALGVTVLIELTT